MDFWLHSRSVFMRETATEWAREVALLKYEPGVFYRSFEHHSYMTLDYDSYYIRQNKQTTISTTTYPRGSNRSSSSATAATKT